MLAFYNEQNNGGVTATMAAILDFSQTGKTGHEQSSQKNYGAPNQSILYTFTWSVPLFMWSTSLFICSTLDFLYAQLNFLYGQPDFNMVNY